MMIIKKIALPYIIGGSIVTAISGGVACCANDEDRFIENKDFSAEYGFYRINHKDSNWFIGYRSSDDPGLCTLTFAQPVRLNTGLTEGFFFKDERCDGSVESFHSNFRMDIRVEATAEQLEKASTVMKQYRRELSVDAIDREWVRWRKKNAPTIEDILPQRRKDAQ